jgi:hypothetical protein
MEMIATFPGVAAGALPGDGRSGGDGASGFPPLHPAIDSATDNSTARLVARRSA